MNSELIKKPLHPKNCSLARRLFISDLLIQWGTLIIPIAPSEFSRSKQARVFPQQHSLVMGKRFSVVLGVKGAKSIDDVVPGNDIARSIHAQIRSRFYRTRVGCPRCQNGALLVQGKVWIANHIRRMRKCTGGM
jgi:hypothetical protein